MNRPIPFLIRYLTLLALLCSQALADAIYVTSASGNSVVRIGANGTKSNFITSDLSAPLGLAFDAVGNLYVSNGNGTIKMFPANGGDAVTFATGLNGPAGLAFSASGMLHAAISGDNKIVRIPSIDNVQDFAPLGTGANPQGIAFDPDGNLFVANKGTDSVAKVTPNGGVSTFANAQSDDLVDPVGVAVAANGRIAVLHSDNGGEIIEFNANGNGNPKSVVDQLGTPTGLAIDSNGDYYVGTAAQVVTKVVGSNATDFATDIDGIGHVATRAAQFDLMAFKNEVLDEPEDAKFASLGSPVIARGGHVAHLGKLIAGVAGVNSSNDSGIWKKDSGNARSLVAREGGPAPDSAGADTSAVFAGFSDPVINDAGFVGFRATLRAGVGGVSSANASGLWAQGLGGLALVARQGFQAPGLAAGANFAGFQQFVLPDEGGLVFLAKVFGTEVNSSNNTGLWAVDGAGVVQLVARKGQVVSVNGVDKKISTFTLFAKIPFSAGQSRSFSTNGALCFRATFTDKSTALLSKAFGTSTLNVVTYKNEIVNVGQINGAKLTNPVTGAVNQDLSVAFRSTLSGGGVSLTDNQAVFLEDNGGLSIVARKSFVAPETDGAIFSGFSDPAINDLGEVAFRAALKGTGGVSVTGKASGLWLGDAGTLALAARQGDIPPGVPAGVKFASFTQFCAPADGGLVFLANLNGDVTTATNQGVWLRDAAGSLDLLLRKGDTLNVDGANRKVSSIVAFKTLPYCGAQGRNVAPDGRVSLLLKFADGYQAIYRITQP